MKKLLFILFLILVAYLAWRWWSSATEAAGRGEEIVYGRMWLDHLPKQETESFQLFAALPDDAVGVFSEQSMWKGQWELFRYEPRGDGQMEMLFPQSRERRRVTYRAWKCAEKQFDFCLEMSAGRGTRKYFSQRGWEVGKRGLEDLRRIEHQLVPGTP